MPLGSLNTDLRTLNRTKGAFVVQQGKRKSAEPLRYTQKTGYFILFSRFQAHFLVEYRVYNLVLQGFDHEELA